MALLSDIQFTSWNVRGLNKTVKLKQVLNRIRQMKAKIVFLQETHLAPEDVVMVRKRWPGQVVPSGNIELRRDAMGNAISVVQL